MLYGSGAMVVALLRQLLYLCQDLPGGKMYRHIDEHVWSMINVLFSCITMCMSHTIMIVSMCSRWQLWIWHMSLPVFTYFNKGDVWCWCSHWLFRQDMAGYGSNISINIARCVLIYMGASTSNTIQVEHGQNCEETASPTNYGKPKFWTTHIRHTVWNIPSQSIWFWWMDPLYPDTCWCYVHWTSETNHDIRNFHT